ncbi:MAG: flagellar basal body rod protein FlgB [Alicyclobacillaceae bacterium]|nr:flagellar basal body rod protein FlgB [Alicyclobacillaceae bacterium]
MRTDALAFQVIQNALSAARLRQEVYANNIANAETPGYKRLDVSFETALQSALAGGLTQAASVVPQVVQSTSTSVDNNGNNVDMDAEMADLAANQIRYNALVQVLQQDFTRLRTAINGGA